MQCGVNEQILMDTLGARWLICCQRTHTCVALMKLNELGCWCMRCDWVRCVPSCCMVPAVFAKERWDGGMGGRAKGDNRKVEGTQDQAPREFISPLACVRGTSSEPIKVVTR